MDKIKHVDLTQKKKSKRDQTDSQLERNPAFKFSSLSYNTAPIRIKSSVIQINFQMSIK